MVDLFAVEIFVGVFIVVIGIFIVFRAIEVPLYLDPFGKKSVLLTHDAEKNEAKKWRLQKIDEAEKQGEKVFLAKAGEFGEGMVETVEYALQRGFSVSVVSGNMTLCDSRTRIIDLLQKFPNKFEYYVLNIRPADHFAIIGKDNLFIEVPHDYNAKIKNSIGINKAHNDIINKFIIKFDKTKQFSKKADVDFVKTMPCYPVN